MALSERLLQFCSHKSDRAINLVVRKIRSPSLAPPSLMNESLDGDPADGKDPKHHATEGLSQASKSGSNEVKTVGNGQKLTTMVRIEFAQTYKKTDVNRNDQGTMIKDVLQKLTMVDKELKVLPRDKWPVNPSFISDSSGKQRAKLSPIDIPTDHTSVQAYFESCSTERHPCEPQKLVMRACIESTVPFGKLKTREVIEYMTMKHAFISVSVFEKIKESTVGWFCLVHPAFTNRDDYAERLKKALVQKLQENPTFGLDSDSPPVPRKETASAGAHDLATISEENHLGIPHLKIVAGQVSAYDKETKQVTRTDALRVKCSAEDTTRLRNLLTALSDVLTNIDTFVPFGVMRANDTILKKLILTQTKFLDSCQLAKIIGFNADALDKPIIPEFDGMRPQSIRSYLLKLGIIAVNQSPAINRQFETLCLIKKSDAEAQRKLIDDTLEDIFDSPDINNKELLYRGYTRARRIHTGGAATSTITVYMEKMTRKINEMDDDLSEVQSIRNVNHWKKPPRLVLPNTTTTGQDEKTVTSSTSGLTHDKTNAGTGTTFTQTSMSSQIESLVQTGMEKMQTKLTKLIETKIQEKIQQATDKTSQQIAALTQTMTRQNKEFQQERTQQQEIQASNDRSRQELQASIDRSATQSAVDRSHQELQASINRSANETQAAFDRIATMFFQMQGQRTPNSTEQGHTQHSVHQQQIMSHPAAPTDQQAAANNTEAPNNSHQSTQYPAQQQHMSPTEAPTTQQTTSVEPSHNNYQSNEETTTQTINNEQDNNSLTEHNSPNRPNLPTQEAWGSLPPDQARMFPSPYQDYQEYDTTTDQQGYEGPPLSPTNSMYSSSYFIDTRTGERVLEELNTGSLSFNIQEHTYMTQNRQQHGLPRDPNWPNPYEPPYMVHCTTPFLRHRVYGHSHPMYDNANSPTPYWHPDDRLQYEAQYFHEQQHLQQQQQYQLLEEQQPSTPGAESQMSVSTAHQTPVESPMSQLSNTSAFFSPTVNLVSRFEEHATQPTEASDPPRSGGETE